MPKINAATGIVENTLEELILRVIRVGEFIQFETAELRGATVLEECRNQSVCFFECQVSTLSNGIAGGTNWRSGHFDYGLKDKAQERSIRIIAG